MAGRVFWFGVHVNFCSPATARRSEVSLRSQITLRLRQIAEKLSIYLRGVEMYEELLLQPVQVAQLHFNLFSLFFCRPVWIPSFKDLTLSSLNMPSHLLLQIHLPHPLTYL